MRWYLVALAAFLSAGSALAGDFSGLYIGAHIGGALG